MDGMHTGTGGHCVGIKFCVKALIKGSYGSSLIGMDACRTERLLDQGIEVPGNISRAIPDWVFPDSTGSSARHQSRPVAVFVRSNPGRSQKAESIASKSRRHAIQRPRGLLGVELLGAWQRRAGEGDFGRPGAWWTTLQVPISSVSGFLLG
eukprot:1152150-Pelagomonas_calceolata.AAC.1